MQWNRSLHPTFWGICEEQNGILLKTILLAFLGLLIESKYKYTIGLYLLESSKAVTQLTYQKLECGSAFFSSPSIALCEWHTLKVIEIEIEFLWLQSW